MGCHKCQSRLFIFTEEKWGFDAMFVINNVSDARYASMVVVNAPGTETRPPQVLLPGNAEVGHIQYWPEIQD